MQRCYEASDLFLLPTRELECFGIPMLESLTFGMPLISTDAGAIPEVMERILPQCIASSGNVNEIGEILKKYYNRTLNLPTSDELFSFVDINYSKQAVVPQLCDMIIGK